MSVRQIQLKICCFHLSKADVGTMNHSEGTKFKMKQVISHELKIMIVEKLREPLVSTGKLRPVLETVDKMTHTHTTAQMQVAIIPLSNKYELLTPIFIGNYLVKYVEGSYAHLITAMRENVDLFLVKSKWKKDRLMRHTSNLMFKIISMTN